ncbi:MarR family transcriptional regulator [Nocardiopsis rhodophaea]|uniref:MarR family transcriptional regulator n=2 Tax=Nocardiopsis rhodophaea TaxID=280238 RepID=A0ABP5EW85_9ACTN
MNRWELSETEARRLREFVSAMMLNGHVTAEIAGLRPIDLYVLNLLDLDGRATPSELARRTSLTTGAITKLIDRLARIGLVERTPDEEDRRRVWLTVSDQASSHVGKKADLFAPTAKRMDGLISGYPEDQRAVLLDFLCRATTELRKATEELQQARPRGARQ